MLNTYYHGADGDKILAIIASGRMMPDSRNEVFFSQFTPDSCFMHGADRKRRASFVIKVAAEIPEGGTVERAETPGVRDTVIVRTADPIKVQVLELFVRRIKDGAGQLERVSGAQKIRSYLTG
jgi:hypothetical protein